MGWRFSGNKKRVISSARSNRTPCRPKRWWVACSTGAGAHVQKVLDGMFKRSRNAHRKPQFLYVQKNDFCTYKNRQNACTNFSKMHVQIRAASYINIKETAPKVHVQIYVICTYKFARFVRTKSNRFVHTKIAKWHVQFWGIVHVFLTTLACTKCANCMFKRCWAACNCVLDEIYVFLLPENRHHIWPCATHSICMIFEFFIFLYFFMFFKTMCR